MRGEDHGDNNKNVYSKESPAFHAFGRRGGGVFLKPFFIGSITSRSRRPVLPRIHHLSGPPITNSRRCWLLLLAGLRPTRGVLTTRCLPGLA